MPSIMNYFTKPTEFALRFMRQASRLYEERCPELSHYFIHEARTAEQNRAVLKKRKAQAKIKDSVFLLGLSMCEHCCRPFMSDHCHVRLRPKRRPAARELAVLRREARGKRLSLAQQALLTRYRRCYTTLMATCHACNKTARYNGLNRDSLMALSKTRPGYSSSSSPKTPQGGSRSSASTPKSAGKNKTPRKTPRPASSSSTPGSSTPSSAKSPSGVKKWVVQRLSKILSRDQKADSKKGTLKEFLSSL